MCGSSDHSHPDTSRRYHDGCSRPPGHRSAATESRTGTPLGAYKTVLFWRRMVSNGVEWQPPLPCLVIGALSLLLGDW
eukprot:486152-Prorocentrum_minimum.AAC.1